MRHRDLITDQDYRELRDHAMALGSLDLVRICDLALRPFGKAGTIQVGETVFTRARARTHCRDVIVEMRRRG